MIKKKTLKIGLIILSPLVVLIFALLFRYMKGRHDFMELVNGNDKLIFENIVIKDGLLKAYLSDKNCLDYICKKLSLKKPKFLTDGYNAPKNLDS